MRRSPLHPFVPAALALALLAGCSGSTSATETVGATSDGEAVAVTVASVDEALADNAVDHDEATDHEWDTADEVAITLAGSSASTDGDGVIVDGSTVTITAAGTYRVSGTLDDGQLVVDTADEGIVRVVLDDADLSSSTTSPFVVTDAAEVVVVLADGTANHLADAEEYVYPDAATDEPDAALFSTADLTITGTGSLDVEGNAYDGITGKDGLVISSGTITVTAVDDGIRGKDYLVVDDGSISVTAGGDALKADDAEDTTMGYVSVAAGTLVLTAGGDGIDAATDVVLLGGSVDVTAGGGSAETVVEDVATKGIKGGVSVVVTGGQVTVDSSDDALHTNGYASVTGGDLVLASADDGVHADAALTVAGGTLTVTGSYEGLEAGQITVSDGAVTVTASDDGINVAGGTDSSGTAGPGGAPAGEMPAGEMPADGAAASGGRGGGAPGGAAAGGDTFTADEEHFLDITGGTIVVNAEGDGLDSNGSIEISGGTTVVNGPTGAGNGAIDAESGVLVTSGTVLAAGSAGMAQSPASSSTQATIAMTFDSGYPAGTVVQVASSDGTVVATFEASKTFQSIVLTAPSIVSGETYGVSVGGTPGADALGGFSTTGDATGSTSVGTVTAV